ncbi:unnamed protein product [Phaedon cochleariae]|uniref:G-patch domain-containing protein n=1 Tax=Phaedon cochleariae TaxID=80249 RepID=A0A9P0GSG2_PHACE|nr:unnamed protein product [Phaedon cochleariae]
MMEPGKKITFAFNKASKKPMVIKSKPVEEEKELIDCLEGQSIIVKNAVVIVKQPLVIPIKDNKRNLLDRVRASRAKADKKQENGEADTRPDSELTIDELAARELLNDAKKRLAEKESLNTKVHVLPLNEENLSLDGEKEATLEDYENVPISDYGLAMLRGMGWKEGSGLGKTAAKIMPVVAPELRPKGLGLGASKLIRNETPSEPVCDKHGQALTLKKGAFAKIIAGSHKGNYCEVQGLDDEGGRIIVRTSLKGDILALNEFLVVPVTKEEYSRGSKILNRVKYEEFKEKEINIVKKEEEKEKSTKYKSTRNTSTENTEESRSKKSHKSGDKHESRLESRSYEVKRSKESKSKSRHREETSSSSSDSELERSRKQHKRKDKRRHRDKSRSPRREKTIGHKKSIRSKNKHGSPSRSDNERSKYSRSRERARSSSSESYKDHRKNK